MICIVCKHDKPESSFGEFDVTYISPKLYKKVYHYKRKTCNSCGNRRSVELAIQRAFKQK